MTSDFMSAPRVFVRIYRMPEKLTEGFCFGGGIPITFVNVDWFEVLIEAGRDGLTDYVKKKKYYDPNANFLVIGDHADFVYIIGSTRPKGVPHA